MFEQTFKNIDDVLWKEAGCATELDYTEQTSWILFLKYLDDLEKANEQKAELRGKKYERIIEPKHRWSVWAAPKKKDGTFDHDRALTGDDLIKYVDDKLFPYLKGFRTRAEGANTVEYKIGEIFSEIENKFRSGYWTVRSASLPSQDADDQSTIVDVGGQGATVPRRRSEMLQHMGMNFSAFTPPSPGSGRHQHRPTDWLGVLSGLTGLSAPLPSSVSLKDFACLLWVNNDIRRDVHA
jgi:hypothetical protein